MRTLVTSEMSSAVVDELGSGSSRAVTRVAAHACELVGVAER